MALKKGVTGSRYGMVDLQDGWIRGFNVPQEQNEGPINGGIYGLSRNVISAIGDGAVSLEGAVFPALAAKGQLRGMAFDSYFIDIGVPEDLARARAELPARLTRPAVFFDRDGVLNVEKNYLHKRSELEWMPGAKEAVRLANDRGWLVFVVTNQAGVARGYYEEGDVIVLHEFMRDELAKIGAHIDAFEYCPHHPEGTRPGYGRNCRRRKPEPGMIEDLFRTWPVDAGRSLLIGDRAHDIASAQAAGIRGHLFQGGNLLDFVKPLLD